MARSKYNFEKREREKAKRQKQIEKSERRMAAKKTKAASEQDDGGPDRVVADAETGAVHLPEDAKARSEQSEEFRQSS